MNPVDIFDVKLCENFNKFCSNQENCVKCELLEKGLINNGHDQPCEQVYTLLRITLQKTRKTEE